MNRLRIIAATLSACLLPGCSAVTSVSLSYSPDGISEWGAAITFAGESGKTIVPTK